MAAILVIDYDFQFRRQLQELLTARGHSIVVCECPEDAFKVLFSETFAMIVSELYLPFSVHCAEVEQNSSFEVGVKTVRELSWALPNCKVVGLSSMSAGNLSRIARFLPTVPIVSKPATYTQAADLIESFLNDEKVTSVH
jgi:DNA-binding NtrC family response regulator